MSMGRFTPATISTRGERNGRLTLVGVPPNMSVRMRASSPTSATAWAMASRAAVTSSLHPMETAAMRGISPTMVRAAFTSSPASCPCVTTTIPIMPSLRTDSSTQRSQRWQDEPEDAENGESCPIPLVSSRPLRSLCVLCVKRPLPTCHELLSQVPVADPHRVALGPEHLGQRVGDHHRAVPAARAADADREVALPLLDVAGDHVGEE